ncbi:MAG: flagellar hook-basal body complex protein [Bacillota bacterium]
MMRSMFSGVSGLRNHQTRMDTIGNNIANVNTVGYKSSRVSFQDTLNQTLRGASAPNGNRGGINAVQVGLGMNLASIDIFQTQGNLQNTGKMTDMAIQGDGFFILSDGQRQYYTRAGNFNIERDGRLTNPSNGLIVQGWMADINGVINNNNPIGNIQLPMGRTIAPIATTRIEFGSNLNALTNGNLSYGKSFVITDASNPQKTASVELQLVPNGFNTFNYTAKVVGGEITAGTGTGTITLDQNGNITNITGGAFQVTPTGGYPVLVNIPANNRVDGGFFIVNPTGVSQDFDWQDGGGNPFTGAPGTYYATVTDQAGNQIPLTYTVTQNGNHYRWSVAVPAGNEVVSGMTGTFDYDVATGITNVSPGNTVIRSSAGYNVTINPPQVGPTAPHFIVVDQAPVARALSSGPQNFPFTNFNGAGDYTNTLMDADGNTIRATFHVTSLGGDQYQWDIDDPDVTGGNVGGPQTGTFHWTAAGGVVGPITGGPLTFTVTASGLNITANAMAAGPGAPNFAVPTIAPIPINGTSTFTVTDALGSPSGDVTLNFAITGAGPNYNWTVTTSTLGAEVISGNTGSFTWTGPLPGNTTNASTGAITIRSANGMLITVNPPINSNTVPTFQQAPGESVMGTFKSPPEVVTTTKVYDSIGTEHIITTTLHKTGTNQWQWVATEGNGLPIQNGSGTLTFDTVTGFVTNMPGGQMTFTPADANPVQITPDFSKVTQGSEKLFTNDDNQWPISTFNSPYQDGYPMGMLQGFNIDKSGRIIGIFSNGMNQNLAQLAVANFTNAAGLSRSGDTLFEESSNSGSAQIGQAGIGGRGLITPGAIEMSNVDLSQEFTDMIVTERGFQANSRIITTTDEMLQELVNLKR